jgi:hypothetical protein
MFDQATFGDSLQCHFFAGIGGWSYALAKVPDGTISSVWTGSCPCQPFSLAGKQKGFADDRHLWPVWRELIRECDPAVVFGEQVASATEWLGLVRGDLEAMGYAVGALPIQAASAGADHLRDRYWFVADADDAGSQGRRLLPERAGQRAAGPGADGVADAHRVLPSRSLEFSRMASRCFSNCRAMTPKRLSTHGMLGPHMMSRSPNQWMKHDAPRLGARRIPAKARS